MMHMQTAGFASHGVGGSGGKDFIPTCIYSGFHRCTFQLAHPAHSCSSNLDCSADTGKADYCQVTELGRVKNMIVKGRSVAVL